MRVVVVLLWLGACLAACAVPSQKPGTPPAPLQNSYSLTPEQVSQYLTACRARRTPFPSEFTDTLCSCTIREVPRWVPREDLDALAHETGGAKKQQLILRSGPMRHVMAQCFSEALEPPAASNREAGTPLQPLPSASYVLTTTQRNEFLTTCRAQDNSLPWPATNAFCSCLIRETPLWVPREDVEAISRETDETKQFQLAFNSRPIRHVTAMCLSEAMEGFAASN